MRIRKRFCLETSLRSDPQLRRSVPPPSDPPFDHIMAIRSIIKTWLLPEDNNKKLAIDETFKVEESKTITHNIRTVITIPSSPDDHQAVSTNKRILIHDPSSSAAAATAQGNWCGGDHELVDPLKKRKERLNGKDPETLHETKSIKCDDVVQFEVSESTSSGGKKIKRGNVILEGSRCSRVNGRGWRCCQPTLVGYSLCEHHLGKGRLRSLSSARRAEITQTSLGGGEDRKLLPLGVTKKRTKIVKARSLNTLLGQI